MPLIIKEIAVEKIRPAAYNPRKDLQPGDAAYDRLKKALSEFDLVEPLVWNKRTGNLVGGHQRFKILKERGDLKVPVSVVDLNDVQEKTLNLALNKQSGEWDFATLADLVQELDTGDFDMAVTGFDEAELESIASWTPPNSGLTDEDQTPDKPKTPTTKPGDLWLLGKHRLLCGDATSVTDVDRLLAGVKPGLMVTDPPYGVNYDPEWRDGKDLGVGERSKGKVKNDDTYHWKEAFLLFPGDVAYVWTSSWFAPEVAFELQECGFERRSQIIWVKQHFALSRGHYHWQHEPCWYVVRHGHQAHWTGDRKQTTVWQIANNNSFGNPKKEQTWGHGTQKPVEVMRRPILNHTNAGQCVYDPFLGAGTTLIACEAEGRVCLSMDIDPGYVDVAVLRWQEFTGKQATLEDGTPFHL